MTSSLRAPGLAHGQDPGRVAAAAAMLAVTWVACVPAEAQAAPESAEREKIEAALPARAVVPPRKPRKLLIFDLNVGYGGHPSIRTANQAFTRMGRKTGAFETVISRDPAVFQPERLRLVDAVFFNNTVGNLFEDPALRQSLVEFVYGGGGLMGVHGTSVAFTRWTEGAREDWPEFALLLGTRGAFHRASTEHVFIKLDDPGHPVNRCFDGKGFEYRDEFFRAQGTYSRNRDRVLFSIDTDRTDLAGQPHDRAYRADNDYALAWVRHYGRGRVFYSTIAHNPYVFWDPKMLEFYLAAAQFVLGDLPAPTIPSGRLTPAIRAQERLGWRLGLEASTFHALTFFETVEKTAQLGLSYLGGLSSQQVSRDIPGPLGPDLTDDELRQVRLKLDSGGVRLLTYALPELPRDPAGCRRLFEFGRKIGVETFVSDPPPEALPALEAFCDAYDIQVAILGRPAKDTPHEGQPEGVLRACEGRGKRIGACPDLGAWMRSGIDPIKGLNTLRDRVLALRLHDVNELGPQGREVPWGTGAGKAGDVIREIHRLGLRPALIGIDYASDGPDPMPAIARSVAFFNAESLRLAP